MRNRLYNILIILVLSIVAIMMLFPIGIMVNTTLQTQGSKTLWSISQNIGINFINNCKTVLTQKYLPRFFINTIIISSTVTVFTLLIGILAGFGFSKLKFKFKNGIFNTLLINIITS